MATTTSTNQDQTKQAQKDWEDLVKRASSGNTAGSRQVVRAISLEAERGELMERIASNREYLRLMDRNEELSEEQAAFLDVFYPEKEKGERRSEDEVEATRLAKLAARKSGSKS